MTDQLSIGIIGGGFGLYGWLPALCQYYPNEKILIELRHQDKFDKRPELQQYKDRIEWVYLYEIFDEAELLVISIPPNKVYDYLKDIIFSKTIKKIIVDKPICDTPEKSEAFIKAIEDKGIKICSSYLFIYTGWLKELNPNEQYEITWIKSNNNLENSWKHKEELGGGQMFYNIHLLALKSYLNNIDINFIHMFSPDYDTIKILNKADRTGIITSPFPKSINGEDNRIPYLLQLLDDFENNYEKVNILMKSTNELWKIEKQKSN